MSSPRKINLFCPGRKPVRKGKLDMLPTAQRKIIIQWLVKDNLTYAEAEKRIAAQFGINVGRNSLCVFFKRHCQTVDLPQSAPAPGTVLAEFVVQLRIPPAQ
jgi:hypothetical protein